MSAKITLTDQQQPHQLKILIVGNGVAAWMAAAKLAQASNKDKFSIVLVSTGTSANLAEPFDDADATLPFGDNLFDSQTSEYEVAKECNGSFSHGIAMSSWATTHGSYFHPFGSIGAPLGPVSFIQVALRLRAQGTTTRLANYCLPALAAQSGKFVPTIDNPQSVLATCQHGLHLEKARLLSLLKNEAKSLGVEVLPGCFQQAKRDQDDSISAVITDTGQSIKADLFLDCSGVSAVLANSGAGGDWQDWSNSLPCNHLVSGVLNTTQAPPPYSHCKAFKSGWIQDVPLFDKTVLNGLYSNETFEKETFGENEMCQELATYLGNDTLKTTFSGPVNFGRRMAPWQNNCISLGTAYGLIDPVGITNLQLLGVGINRLTSLLPGQQTFTAVQAEYNRQMNLLLDHARDFAAMHYKLNGRRGESFWDNAQRISLPDSLNYKLELYRSRGLIPLYDEEPLSDASWINLLDEHGIKPRQYSTIADGFSAQALQDHVQKIRVVMMEALQQMPSHGDFLTQLNKKT